MPRRESVDPMDALHVTIRAAAAQPTRLFATLWLALVESVRSLGMEVVALPTVMRTLDDRVALAHEVLDFAANIRARKEAEVE